MAKAWMTCARIRSKYELYLLVEIPRATLQRWFTGRVRIPVAAARKMAEALAAELRSDEPLQALEQLVNQEQADPWAARLRFELRVRRVPVRRALDAIRATNGFFQSDTDSK